jgi:hypothetical protein
MKMAQGLVRSQSEAATGYDAELTSSNHCIGGLLRRATMISGLNSTGNIDVNLTLTSAYGSRLTITPPVAFSVGGAIEGTKLCNYPSHLCSTAMMADR